MSRASCVPLARISALILPFGFALLTPAVAAIAPKQLHGKSIVVSWTEHRMQRQTGGPPGAPQKRDFQPVTNTGRLSVYISSQGNVFNRMTRVNRRGLSGSRDKVGSNQIDFQGNSMIATQTGNVGGALRIVVAIDPGLVNCTAEVIRGKEEGAAIIHANSLIYPGMKVEIKSVRVSGVSCTIRDGNVFSGE